MLVSVLRVSSAKYFNSWWLTDTHVQLEVLVARLGAEAIIRPGGLVGCIASHRVCGSTLPDSRGEAKHTVDSLP